MSVATLNADRLGVDLDIPVDPAGAIRPTGTGDVPRLSGTDNLLRSVARMLVTRRGELVYRPDYGVGILDYIGRANRPSERQRLAAAIRVGLLADARLADASVTVSVGLPTDASDVSALTVAVVLTLRDGSTLSTSIPVTR